MVNLTISDITWDSFTVSWSPQDGDFESFVIELTNLDGGSESQNLTLSGDAFSLGIPVLRPNTTYMVGLYGLHQGSFLEPVYAEATTGTCRQWSRSRGFSILTSCRFLFLFFPLCDI